VRGIHDVLSLRRWEVRFFLNRMRRQKGIRERVRSYKHYEKLLADKDIDLVLVTTPTCFHRQHTLAALQAGKRVYLDKPIAVTLEDSDVIVKAVKEAGSPVLMGFTRRYEAVWRKAYELVSQGAIGQLTMMQIRSVIPYTRYYHLWHRRNAWSGGALNDKCSHHMDVFNWFAAGRCTAIAAIGSQSPQFTPREDAPDRCLNCTEEDCPYNLYKDPLFEEMNIGRLPPSWRKRHAEMYQIDNCVFAPGADIIDHTIANLQYDNGIKASLFFNIYGPKASDQETFELIGTQGRLTLTRHTGEIALYSNYGKKYEVIETPHDEFTSSHFGADLELVREMDCFMKGADPIVSVREGHESLRMIHAIQSSIERGGKQVLMDEVPYG
jgi:predicted dehydrogenase